MRARAVAHFADASVRASPEYRLEASEPAGASPWAGVVVPVGPGWRRRQLVSGETASLIRSLTRPAGLPPTVDPLTGARLVLDGILELVGKDGIRSGPAAHTCFRFSHRRTGAGPPGAIGRLSAAALRDAAALGIADPSVIGRLLYRFNTLPASPAWRARFPTDRMVGQLYGSAAASRRERWNSFVTKPEGAASWRVWDRTGAAVPAGPAPTYKLYISPRPESLAEACRAVLALGAGVRGRPFSVKAGNNLPSILRSEKLVAYFLTRDDLFEGARRLARRLAGMPAQGVPFTAELFGAGLLSWGLDPGSDAEPPGPLRQSSWRRWITARLAAAMANAAAAGPPVSPVRFALDRVRLDGVDPDRWTAPAWFAAISPSDADH